MKTSLNKTKLIAHRCVNCGKTFPHSFTTVCDRCGAMVDVYYDLERTTLHDSENPLERYFDLLPIEDSANLLPLEMQFTPTIHATKLGEYLGMPSLYLKNETVLPTGTTKDRMAAVVLSFLGECGIREFCTSSTGNSSTALAYLISRYPEFRVYVFSGEDFKDRLNYADGEGVVHFVLRGGTFVEAFACAASFAGRHNLTSERGFFNPSRREGLKLAFLEAAEQVPKPIDWYVQAVSSAMGVYGTFKGARELHALGRIPRLPRLLCVQQETCAPMVRAFEDGSEVIRPEHVVERPHGIADAILRGNPEKVYPYVRQIVIESNGAFEAVSESEIREARSMVEEMEGLSPCFTSSAALAGMIRMLRKSALPPQDTVLVNVTGRDRQPAGQPQRVHWLKATAEGWEPEDPNDETTRQLWYAPGGADWSPAEQKGSQQRRPMEDPVP
jgi:threonine synthase